MSGAKSTSPANSHYAIVPSDTVDLLSPTRAIRCDAAGTAVIHDYYGVAATYNLTAGEVIPICASRVAATGTTATLIAWH